MGFGFSHYVLYLHMQKTFNKRRGLATGLFAATRAASGALMPQLAVLLSGVAGYASMMRIVAAMTLLGVVFSFVQTHKVTFKPDGHKEARQRSVDKPTAVSSTMTSPSCDDVDNNEYKSSLDVQTSGKPGVTDL
jgi:cyanate permease